MSINVNDKRAPMPSAPMKYREDGSVDWANMWDSYCLLALDGGPPHRGAMLYAQEDPDTTSAGYCCAVKEIGRGIYEVSGLSAEAAEPGWIAVACDSVSMANWLVEAINEENVQARAAGTRLLLPVGENYTLKGEIKNVITAVAKTTHYWGEHLPSEVKQALALQARMNEWLARLKERLGRWGGGGSRQAKGVSA